MPLLAAQGGGEQPEAEAGAGEGKAHQGEDQAGLPEAVTARKDDASAAHQAALTKVAGRDSFSVDGGLIHTTSG